MNAITTTRAALFAVTLAASALSGIASAAASNSQLPDVSVSGDAVALHVTAAVRDVVGNTSPEITVTNRAGEVTLGGWARNANDVSKASSVAATVPGVKQVYAAGVHLWSSRAGF